jgi:hypothetical protein
VLTGWLAERGISDEERATWEACGETFLRRLRKAVDGQRHVGALGLPDLRQGVRLALARHDERSAAVPGAQTVTAASTEVASPYADFPLEDGEPFDVDGHSVSIREPAENAVERARLESDADRLCDVLQRSEVAPAWSRSWTVADVARRLRPEWCGAAVVVDPPSTPVGVRNLQRVAEAANVRLQWRT